MKGQMVHTLNGLLGHPGIDHLEQAITSGATSGAGGKAAGVVWAPPGAEAGPPSHREAHGSRGRAASASLAQVRVFATWHWRHM